MKLKLKREARKARVLSGHPWVFGNELETIPEASADGTAMALEDARGRFLGMGIVNTKSRIVWRRYSQQASAWGPEHWAGALERAEANREEEAYRRLVWSEADDLPGLVVDQFGEYLVVQSLTLGVERNLGAILGLLQERHGPRDILLRNDAPTRRHEGMVLEQRTLSGQGIAPFVAEIYDIRYELNLGTGQKTGFYLDQRQEHFKVATLAPGWRVLDAFCNQGAFGLHCAQAGAREVIGLDSSAEAVEAARRNAELNGLAVDFRQENVFDWFTRERGQSFDLIILDPPSFAPNRRAVAGAWRGYKELQLRAMKALTPGGILATYCCSHHIGRGAFREIVEAAAGDVRRPMQLLYETGQPMDHPVRLGFPESEYLKGLVVRANG